MWHLIWPMLLVVAANTFYNICTKSTPENINTFASLSITYFAATLFSIMLFFITGKSANLIEELSKANWTAVALAVSIVALEFGYVSIYRAGWKVSLASLIANLMLAIVLLGLGTLLYKEMISFRQVIGVAVCVLGLFLISN